jgi:RHS repeat-associated protein
VLKSTGETILYYYDATGRKLSQLVRDPSGIQKKSTGYHGEYIYENDSLKFTNHEEGRVIMKDGEEPEYQYHLKDHLGNVRMTFTTKDEVDSVRATLEVNHAAEDSVNFLNYDKARLIYGSLFDHTNGASPGYAQRLSGAEGEKIGLAKSFSVMPGDVITAEVFAKYFDVPQDPGTLPMILQTLLNNLLNPAASGGAVIDRVGYGTSGSLGLPFLEGFGEQDDEDVPKAFLNYIYINRDFDVESIRMGFEPITEAALEDGMGGAHERLVLEYTVKEAGYVYVYLSNDGEEVREVYFDDFKVEHIKSPVISSQDYYPFGLTFNAYQRESSVPNQFQYNGKEIQNELGLGWLDYGARMYMPEIGRWGVLDPKAESYEAGSPYTYAFDNPIRFIDLIGRDPGDVVVIFDGADLFSGYSEGNGARMESSVEANGGDVRSFVGQYWMSDEVHRQTGLTHEARTIDMHSDKDLDQATQAAYDYVKESRKTNKDGKTIIYGYSWGGVLANHLAKRLKEDKITETDFLIIVDAANGRQSDEVDRDYSESAERVDNYYTPDRSNRLGSHGKEGKPKEKVNNKVKVTYTDTNGKKKTVTHSNIDEATFDEILKSINDFLNK